MKSLDEVKTIIEGSPNFRFAKIELQNDNLVCRCNADQLIDNVVQLKRHSDLKFRQLVDILAVDYPNREKRFEIIYLFLSHENNLRISIKIDLEDQQRIQTLTNVFPSANWLEREVFDMYGINFKDHPDLRRILTDYGFIGHPFRKDFPLIGETELRYDHEQERCIYEAVSIVPRVGVPKVIRSDWANDDSGETTHD